jgi:sugar phosphate isomerase/epimerase
MISIGTTFNYDITLEKQLPMIKSAGFSHVSLGARIEHSRYLTLQGQKSIRQLLEENDLEVCSLHTPFGRDIDISSPADETKRNTIMIYSKCIDAALALGARVVIFHPTAYMRFDHLGARKGRIVENVGRLLDHIGHAPVRLAIENERFEQPNAILISSLEAVPDPRYGFCYDSSHDNLTARPLTLLQKFGHRLLTTHISDNRGKDDDHMLPYEGSFQWNDFCKVFSNLHFGGVFLLEVEMRESSFKTPQEFLKEAFTRGHKLLNTCHKK